MTKRMPVMRRGASACCGLLILIAGCSETKGRWENAILLQEAWARDEASCREQASQRVNQEHGRAEESRAGRSNPTSSVATSMEWQGANRRNRELLESCMARKGYVWATTKENEE